MVSMADYPDPDQPNKKAMAIWLLVSAIAIVAVGIWAFANRSFSSDVAGAATVVADAASAVAEVVKPLLESKPADEAPAVEATETATAPPNAGRRAAARADRTAGASLDSVQPLAAPLSVVPTEGPVTASPVSGGAPPPPLPDFSSSIFDANDADVTPPALVTPLVNAPLPRETLKAAEPLSIEILVNADGTVASARVTSEPESVAENLQVVNALSIAKSWTFGPAMKEGRPVNYRMFVALDKVLMWRSRIKHE